MKHELKPLPFKKELKGISQKTIDIHYNKLYGGYVNKRNEIEEKLLTADKTTANGTYGKYSELKRQESFASNGVILHEYYFMALGGEGGEPDEEFKNAIIENFGSYENWIEDFKSSGMSARGWVVLAYDHNTKKLRNYLCDAHNQGGIWGAMPILVLDTYEHAYYIDYGSDRKTYIEDFFANLNWPEINNIYKSISK